jgi:hypothetical protein
MLKLYKFANNEKVFLNKVAILAVARVSALSELV